MIFKKRRKIAVSELQRLAIMQGLILSRQNENINSLRLTDYEFSVFSQWGEDGIIQRLTRSIEIKNKTFIEFGVENFRESNCRFLMLKDYWDGFVIDSSELNITSISSIPEIWKYNLKAIPDFVTRENINSLLSRSEFERDLGILSIDIDGMDYWVLKEINGFEPRILILEFNDKFGPDRKITLPYSSNFTREGNPGYHGASLAAMVHLANEKGYALVGVNKTGCNAFFVRRDLMNSNLAEISVADAFAGIQPRLFGKKPSDDLLAGVRGLSVINVETGSLEAI
jgi:hypothetical protein